MCRHLAYLGPAVALDTLLFEPEHSLLRQASSPRFQTVGHDNPHGFGAGWFTDAGSPPARYRAAKPIWADDEFASRAHHERAVAVLAAVRNATPGSAIDERGNAPFISQNYLFSLNGSITGFRDGIETALRERVSPGRSEGIEGDTDAELLFAMALDHLDRGASVADALVATVRTVTELARGSLNLMLTDGETIAATAYGNSLFTHAERTVRVVASEPYDDDLSWQAVPDRSVVTADAHGVTITSISPGAAA
jgi:gamma-glutamyl hercynylcysteine S-oxide hydrolase